MKIKSTGECYPYKYYQINKACHGFTLVELMVALALGGLVVAAIFSVYTAQQRTYLAQEQVAQMQQNLRAGFYLMTRDLRMAGYNPGGGAGSDITAATANSITFTADLNEDGDVVDTGEDLTYSLYVAGDGIQKLGRRDNTTAAPAFQAVAENFEALEFRYLDRNEAVTTVASDVRSVQISILARADKADNTFTNSTTYTAASGAIFGGAAYNDNFRRRLLITTVNCRNLGL